MTGDPQPVMKRRPDAGSYPDRVQVMAVLASLYPGRYRGRIVKLTRVTQRRWRDRVEQLRLLNYMPLVEPVPTANVYLSALACQPAFAFVSGHVRTCKLRTLCPFCWARYVRDIWLEVDRAFFRIDTAPGPVHRGARSRGIETDDEPAAPLSLAEAWRRRVARSDDFDLVTRVLRYPVAANAGRDQPLEDQPLHRFFRLRARVRAGEHKLVLAGAQPWGALETVLVTPDTARGRWVARVMQLFLVPRGYRVAPQGPRDRPVVVPTPVRRDVLRAVARTLRYPPFLIAPAVPAGGAANYAAARAGIRVLATSGVFRKEKPR